MRRRVRVKSPLLEATFDLERPEGGLTDTEFVRGISDVALPVMTGWSFWLVEQTLKRANQTAFSSMNDVPWIIEELAEPSQETLV